MFPFPTFLYFVARYFAIISFRVPLIPRFACPTAWLIARRDVSVGSFALIAPVAIVSIIYPCIRGITGYTGGFQRVVKVRRASARSCTGFVAGYSAWGGVCLLLIIFSF
jgi:hypothetical protein